MSFAEHNQNGGLLMESADEFDASAADELTPPWRSTGQPDFSPLGGPVLPNSSLFAAHDDEDDDEDFMGDPAGAFALAESDPAVLAAAAETPPTAWARTDPTSSFLPAGLSLGGYRPEPGIVDAEPPRVAAPPAATAPTVAALLSATAPDVTVPDVTVPDVTVPDVTVPDVTAASVRIEPFDADPGLTDSAAWSDAGIRPTATVEPVARFVPRTFASVVDVQNPHDGPQAISVPFASLTPDPAPAAMTPSAAWPPAAVTPFEPRPLTRDEPPEEPSIGEDVDARPFDELGPSGARVALDHDGAVGDPGADDEVPLAKRFGALFAKVDPTAPPKPENPNRTKVIRILAGVSLGLGVLLGAYTFVQSTSKPTPGPTPVTVAPTAAPPTAAPTVAPQTDVPTTAPASEPAPTASSSEDSASDELEFGSGGDFTFSEGGDFTVK